MLFRKTIISTSVAIAACLSFLAPAAAATFPVEGKRFTMVVGSGAGGSADLFYRLLAKGLEKEIGSNIEIINKAGAGTQLGLQAVHMAKPDGYTIGQAALPTAIMVYLEPERQAQFNGDSFIPVSMVTFDPAATAVRADSPYKTIQDLVAAAKANPGKIKFGSGAKASRQHLDVLQLEKASGADFLNVHADSSSSPVTMLLGGHLDVIEESVSDFLSMTQSGQLRILGVWNEERSAVAPDVATMKEQGYPLYSGTSRGVILPAGTPAEAVKFWDDAIKKVVDTAEFKEGMAKLNQPIRYMDNAAYTAHWKEMEAGIKPFMSLIK